MNCEYRKATLDDLAYLWNRNITKHLGDTRWRKWKKEYIGYNRSGKAATFAVVCNGKPVGEGTLLFSPTCSAIGGRAELADGASTANINALRIRRHMRDRGIYPLLFA